MILVIDTTNNDSLSVALFNNEKLIAKRQVKSPRRQSEKLLPAISRLLLFSGVKLGDLKTIRVANQGGSFTSLRIGVLTANTLAYALNIPVETLAKDGRRRRFASHYLVEPEYDREPNIGISQKGNLG